MILCHKIIQNLPQHWGWDLSVWRDPSRSVKIWPQCILTASFANLTLFTWTSGTLSSLSFPIAHRFSFPHVACVSPCLSPPLSIPHFLHPLHPSFCQPFREISRHPQIGLVAPLLHMPNIARSTLGDNYLLMIYEILEKKKIVRFFLVNSVLTTFLDGK